MNISGHLKEHLVLNIPSIKNSKNVIVGVGGHFSSIQNAVTSLGSRWANRLNDGSVEPPTQSLTFTNLSSTVVKSSLGTGIAFTGVSGTAWRVGDFLTTDSIKYYRIKKVIDTNTLELWGPWSGTTGNFNCQPKFLDRANLLLMPGDYGLENYALPPGINLLGFDKNSVSLSRDRPFTTVGENFLYNLTIGPTLTFGSMDQFAGGSNDTELGHGCSFYASNIRIICGSYNGAHNGGNLSWPIMTGGYSYLVDSEVILNGNTGSFSAGGLTGVTSIVRWSNVRIDNDTDIQSVSGGLALSALDLSYNSADFLTVYLDNLRVLFKDIGKNPTIGSSIGGVVIANPNSTVYINGLKSETRNSNTSAAVTEKPVSVYVASGTVHIDNSKMFASGQVTGPANAGEGLTVDGGTVHVKNSDIYGLKYGINISAGTVNLHNTQVEGGLSAINNTAGTVNVEKGVYITGPVVGALVSTIRGVITLNGATPVTITTSKAHTNSRIKLSRQVAAGTMGHFGVGAITNNTSFTVVGTAGDTSAVMWELEE